MDGDRPQLRLQLRVYSKVGRRRVDRLTREPLLADVRDFGAMTELHRPESGSRTVRMIALIASSPPYSAATSAA